MNLQDKTFLVTGGGSGMGRELVLALLSEKCDVIAVDINSEGLDATAGMSGNPKNLRCFAIDITDSNAVSLLAEVVTSLGKIDGIINNAGIIQPFVHTEELDIGKAKHIFDVNFWGTFRIIHYFLPYLKTRPEAQVVNISSMGGFLPVPGQTVYGASKAAVKMLSESLSIELKDTNVNVITVFPGAMNTDIRKNSGIDDGRPTESNPIALNPQDAARQIVAAMYNDTDTLYLGEDSRSMEILYRTDPLKAINKVSAMIGHRF